MNALAPKSQFVIELEQDVLGAILVGGDIRRINFLEDSHFVEPIHGAIYRVIKTAMERYNSTTMPIVARLIPDDLAMLFKVKLDTTASAYLARLAANTLTTDSGLENGARKVVEQWARMCIAHEASLIQAAAQDPASDPSELVSKAGVSFDDIMASIRRGPKRKTRTILAGAASNAIAAAREAQQRGSGLTGITWGLTDVNRLTGGMQRRDLTLIAARPSMGKAQPLTAKVRTPQGWRAIGEIRVGDSVSSVDGDPSVVTGVFPQGEKKIYRVAFSDGRSTRCCADHLWRVHYRGWDVPRVLSTEQIAEKLSLARYRSRLWIDMPVASGSHDTALPIDPWVLGALIGDGGFSSDGIRFSSACDDTIARMQERISECRVEHVSGSSYDYSITMRERLRTGKGHPSPNIVKEALRSLALMGLTSERKFIPLTYLNAGPEQRLDLLRGLLDTDGWVERHGTVCFCTVSRQLADDVCELARSLGAWCSIKTRQKSYTYKGERKPGRPAHVCVISHPNPASLFLMTSKVEKARPRVRRKFPTFASIVPDGVEHSQCISVSHPSRLYVTDDYVVTHNTTVGLSTAISAARSGAGVGFVSLEMDADKLGSRALTDLAFDWGVKVAYSDLIRGDIQEREIEAIESATRDLERLPLWIEDQSGLTMLDIRAKVEGLMTEMAKSGSDLDVLFVDHLGLIRPSSRYQGNRTNEVAEITAGMKQMAREFGISVVLLSQLNRALEQRDNKRPQLSDLRDSGAIEQDADTIIFLYREAYYLQRERGSNFDAEADRIERLADCQNKLEFIVAKQRNGQIATVDLFADMACAAIRNGVRI